MAGVLAPSLRLSEPKRRRQRATPQALTPHLLVGRAGPTGQRGDLAFKLFVKSLAVSLWVVARNRGKIV